MAPGVVSVRDVDALDSLPDAKLQAADKAYLERHGIDKMLGDMLSEVVQQKPGDPTQFIIDALEYNFEYAAQDPETGLPQHRKAKLLDVFRIMDHGGQGKISLSSLQSYASKHGATPLGDSELQSIFTDFQPGSDNLITQHEFLVYFSKASRSMSNAAFESMVHELLK